MLTILGCCTLIAWWGFYKRTKKRAAFLPISLPFVLLVTIISIKIYRGVRKDEPVLLSAGTLSYGLTLKGDGTYQLSEEGDLNGYSRYGNYNLAGDTIYLDKITENMGIKFPKLVIKHTPYDTVFHTNTFIFQVNQQGDIVDSVRSFPVMFDNRKK